MGTLNNLTPKAEREKAILAIQTSKDTLSGLMKKM